MHKLELKNASEFGQQSQEQSRLETGWSDFRQVLTDFARFSARSETGFSSVSVAGPCMVSLGLGTWLYLQMSRNKEAQVGSSLFFRLAKPSMSLLRPFQAALGMFLVGSDPTFVAPERQRCIGLD